MVFAAPFSVAFWLCYLCGGLSDILDGFVARKWKLQSAFGAKLDSFADMVFAVSLAVVVIRNFQIPAWLWLCIAGVAALRFFSYGINFYKYRTFVSLHTYANKATGALIFVFPVLCLVLGLTATEIILCLTAFFSSLEEVAIAFSSRAPNRDRKSIFLP
ncbi:MAG: CDP-alcohol phosphatidyltransferase family protein [Faecalibacterium sp.]|jgi:CDP-diacylglycerol--glycerol-3-phosphate 3-phosphatidyltransferase|nr:CDP-alcohol phosphatidyltransferase family protein [Faecalibacterium sp.]